jgi:hypothetical protein
VRFATTNKYVKDEDGDIGPVFRWVDQNGDYYSSNVSQSRSRTAAAGSGVLRASAMVPMAVYARCRAR